MSPAPSYTFFDVQMARNDARRDAALGAVKTSPRHAADGKVRWTLRRALRTGKRAAS